VVFVLQNPYRGARCSLADAGSGDDERASQRFARVGNEDREEEDSNRDVDYAKAPSGPSRRHGGEGINLERFVERIKSP
jgi:hypothetical protein